jgi:hypothetical protein
MIQRTSPREDDLIDLPISRRDIADYLGLTLDTVSRDLERRGAIEISGRRSVMLRNHSANGRGETPAELFVGVSGHRPKTEKELQEWLVSPEGKTSPRRFPPPWTVEQQAACLVVRDHTGQSHRRAIGAMQECSAQVPWRS